MKATIDFDERLYRRLKARAALRGRTVKELVAEGVRRVLDEERPSSAGADRRAEQGAWFGMLRRYAGNAKGAHDLKAIRRSIARARAAETSQP